VERLFWRNWIAVGFAASLPEPGDAAPLEIFGLPLLLMRGDDRAIRVFHNVGAHDGCPVVTAPRSGPGPVVGPYHGWQYDWRGRLIKAPFWDGTPDPDVAGLRAQGGDLKEIRSGVWRDMVFADLSGECAPLEQFLAPVISLFADHEVEGLELAMDSPEGDGLVRFDTKANWKPLWENYAPNVYHEGFVHEQYRRSAFVPRVDEARRKTFTEVNDGIVKGISFETARVTNTYPAVEFPKIKSKRTGKPVEASYILNIYPNSTLLVFPTHWRARVLVPQDAEHSQWLIASYYDGGAARDPAYLAMRQKSIAGSIKARDEDDGVCELVQRARRSPAHQSHFYSPFWDRMHYDFNRMVLADLERQG
jgi:choline monooxygenase